MEILPEQIHSTDGDLDIGAAIKYKINEPYSCSTEGSFTIDEGSGILTWSSPIANDCLLESVIYVQVEVRRKMNICQTHSIIMNCRPSKQMNLGGAPPFLSPSPFHKTSKTQNSQKRAIKENWI